MTWTSRVFVVVALVASGCGSSLAPVAAKDAAGGADLGHPVDAAIAVDATPDVATDLVAPADAAQDAVDATVLDIASDAAASKDVAPSCTDPCDDGDPCTLGDHCAAGKCVPGLKATWTATSAGPWPATASAVALSPGGQVVALSHSKANAAESDSDIDIFSPGAATKFAIHVGSAGQDELHATCVGAAGSVFVGATTSASAGGWDGWLVHVDSLSANAKTTVKQFGGAGDEEFYGVAPAGDGWLLAGYKAADAQADPHLWLLRIDAQDQPVWDFTYGNTALDAAYDVTALSDGSFVAVGETATDGIEHVWLLRVGADGKEIWSHVLHAETDSTGWAVVALPGDDIAIAGRIHPKGDVNHAWLARFDSKGTGLSEATLGPGIAYALTARPDGSLVLAGENAKAATWVAAVGADNKIVWQQSFGGFAARGVAADAQGGLAIVATVAGSKAGSVDRWVGRLDALGGVCK